MIENAQGNYIDNAIAAVEAELAKADGEKVYEQVKRELLQMKHDLSYVPGYGRFLVDSEPRNPDLRKQVMEVAYWRQRKVERAARQTGS